MREERALSRRRLLRNAAALGALGAGGSLVAACATAAAPSPIATARPTAAPLPPPEVTTLTLSGAASCEPWMWLADEFLREEGFTDIQRAKPGQSLLTGAVDVSVAYANVAVTIIDAGQPLVVLGGCHVGCLEVWAAPGIGGIGDLRGKRIPISARNPLDLGYSFWISALTSVGIGPNDVNWIENPDLFNARGAAENAEDAFISGKVDVYLAGPTVGFFFRQNPKNTGRKILDITMDKPWSQNFCCLLVTNRGFAEHNPVATKRMTRAILRAIDFGAADVSRATRAAIDQKIFPPRITYEALYDTLKDMPYAWRDYSPEDTLRFFALRLADGKLIKKTPEQIVTDGTDLAYFKQLRNELKSESGPGPLWSLPRRGEPWSYAAGLAGLVLDLPGH